MDSEDEAGISSATRYELIENPIGFVARSIPSTLCPGIYFLPSSHQSSSAIHLKLTLALHIYTYREVFLFLASPIWTWNPCLGIFLQLSVCLSLPLSVPVTHSQFHSELAIDCSSSMLLWRRRLPEAPFPLFAGLSFCESSATLLVTWPLPLSSNL